MAASISALMPIDRVSSAKPSAFGASNTALTPVNNAQAATKSGAGSGILMMPRKRNRGKAATCCASASASWGSKPERFANFEAAVHDMDHYQSLLLDQLTRIEGVTGVHSSFVLRRVVDKTALAVMAG